MKRAIISDVACPAGTPSVEREMRLRAGAKGRGRIIQAVRYWPESPKSESAALDILSRAAASAGYLIS